MSVNTPPKVPAASQQPPVYVQPAHNGDVKLISPLVAGLVSLAISFLNIILLQSVLLQILAFAAGCVAIFLARKLTMDFAGVCISSLSVLACVLAVACGACFFRQNLENTFHYSWSYDSADPDYGWQEDPFDAWERYFEEYDAGDDSSFFWN